ncbi:MAG: TonB-dependent receptor [Melioribacteraceae bacterium]|nr:TonB-dependent receptor [Melioribacteraceae bacterium]
MYIGKKPDTNYLNGRIKLLHYLLIFLLVAATNYAQNGRISGSVKDDITGEVLIGANVFIASLNIGASSDVDGNYIIENIPAGTYTIIARYVGFKQVTEEVVVRANSTTQLDFRLESTAVQLNELVVTGQGVATERRKLTSTVESISADDIGIAPVESVDQLLQGRVPGLTAFNSSGMPGTSGRIAARGLKSVLTNATPVVYVDNVRVDNQDAFRLALDTGGAETSALSDLVVGEIDRIEVIKGGAASTLFGSEAANGVIQIFTKKGVPGKPRWHFNVTSGFDAPNTEFVSEKYVKDNVLRTGYYQGYDFSAMGGAQDFTYHFGGKTFLNDGIIVDNVSQSKGYNLNAGFRVHLSDISNLEISSSYTKSQFRRTDNNNLPTAPYGGFEDGAYADQWGYNDHLRDSVLALMLSNDVRDDVDRFRTAVNYDITPVKDFTNKFTFGLDYRKNEERQFVPKKAGDLFATENGFLFRADREYLTVTLSYIGSYILPKLGPVTQTLAFGAQGFRVEDREGAAQGQNFAIPGTEDFDNASLIDAQESNRQLFSGGLYLVDQIGIFDKIFIDLGIRADGNSTFGEDVGLQYYPKAGIAYNISDESFYPEALKSYVSSLKLRTSWGQTGNFPPPFTKDRTYASNSFLDRSGLAFNNPGDPELKPEKTSSVDAGFDMGLFNDRVAIEFNYFKQITKDGLFLVPNDPASGFGLQYKNVGEILNEGIELSIYAQVLQSENFSADVRFSFATLENEVTDLGGSAPFSIASFTFLPRRVEEGYTLGVFRVNKPIKDAEGNYTGDYETVLEGSPLPKQTGSFSFNVTLFKNLSIRSLTEFAFGHQVVNLKKTLRYFNQTEDAADAVPDGYSFETASQVWVEDADWIKVREIGLTYRLPESLLKGITLNASLRNVAEFGIKTSNLDPELNSFQPSQANVGGYGYLDVSAPRQFRFSVTYNF